MRHTPGPWIWANNHCGLYGAGKDNAVLHFASYEGMWLAGDNEKANARLIAAAPDLLEALQLAGPALRQALSTLDSGDAETIKIQRANAVVCAAIAKAEGK